MKTLCLYFSRTGLTKKAMTLLAEELGADLAEYTDGVDRRGFFGYVGACFASMKRTLPRVAIKGVPELNAYDRVVIGMPTWVEGPCAVGRALIRRYADRLPGEVYFVVTHMAKNDYLPKIRALDRLLGRPSAGQLSVQTKDHDFTEEIKNFALKIK